MTADVVVTGSTLLLAVLLVLIVLAFSRRL